MPERNLLKSILHRSLLVLGVCLATAFFKAHAQKASDLFKSGDKAFGQKDYRTAINFYEQGLAQKPNYHKANYRLGFSYLAIRQPQKAKPRLLAVHNQTNKYNPELFFMLAQSYHLTHSFDSAMAFYRDFRDALKARDYEALDRVEKNIDECRVGQKLIKNPVKIRLENLGPAVNSPHADFVPVINQEENLLIFTSRRQGSTGGKLAPDGQPLEDVYFSVKEKGKWTDAINMGPPVNTDRNDACVGISPDGNRLFLYKDTNGGDIYVSEKRGKSWSTPVSMGPVINSPHYEPSLSISSDGDYVFFSSNRPDGFGGLDLYISVKQPDGTWGEALNLGPTINTSYDEDAPFIHSASNTLYFSSRGHQTMGGHDIFKSDINAFTWSEPQNIGYPINTAGDDIHYIVPSSSKVAYFSSLRQGGQGLQDIYRLVYLDGDETATVPGLAYETDPVEQMPNSEPVLPPNHQLIEGRVTDAQSDRPIATQITFSSLETGRQIFRALSDSLTGVFKIALPIGTTFGVSAGESGYAYYSSVYTMPANGSAQLTPLKISLKKLTVGDNLVLHNIYFESNQAEITPGANQELTQLFEWLLQNPTVRLEISGHTDNTGNAKANLDLSRRRAEAVYKYLTEKGIDSERLTAKGYGDTRPVASNDTLEGRTRNRRTEYIIIGK